MAKPKPIKEHLLIEIGTEEMPANYLAYGDQDQQALYREKFQHAFNVTNSSGSYTCPKLNIFLTPRRTVIEAPEIQFNATPIEETIFGPPAEKAYNDAGEPTPMLLGFIKSKGVSLKGITTLEKNGKKCVGFTKTVRPAPFAKELPELLERFLKSLSFPKNMWWDDSDMTFPRPIRWLVCLLDNRLVPVTLGHLKSSRKTRIFRHGARREVLVSNTKQYFKLLQKNGVLLDQAKRRSKIEGAVRSLTKKLKGYYWPQDELLEEVTFLTENPAFVSGRFDETYSSLPPEVLTTSLAKGQRLFSVLNSKGKHLPYFIQVLDGTIPSTKSVIATTAAILKAKLQDSDFFYREDMKIYRDGGKATGLNKLQEELKHLLYIKGMGTVADKVARLKRVSEVLVPRWGLEAGEVRMLAEAIPLAKVDLLTQMVGEFPELQGTIGKYYFLEARGKEKGGVAEILREQYLPRTPESPLPKTACGSTFSILDKADLIASCFVLGKMPKATQDPYALKRSFAGILRIVGSLKLNVDWKHMMETLLGFIEKQHLAESLDIQATLKKLNHFYLDRSANFYENQGHERDFVQAVLGVSPWNILNVSERLVVLRKLKNKTEFKKTVKIIQRTTNIIKATSDFEVTEVKSNLFKEALEIELYEKYEKSKESIQEALSRKDYALGTSLYAEAFFDILHAFFDQVMVNVDDAQVRQNRLSLLASIRMLYVKEVADLSKIRVEAEEDN